MQKKHRASILALVIMLVCFAVLAMAYAIFSSRLNLKIEDYLETGISYEESDYEAEVALLTDWSESIFVSDWNKGKIHERLSVLYNYMGDEQNYYTEVGKALMYLQNTENTDGYVNLKLDLCCTYLCQNDLELAQNAIADVDDIVTGQQGNISVQMQSYYYRLKAIICMITEEYDQGIRELDLADQLASQDLVDGEVNYATIYLLCDKAVRAEILVKQDKYEEAKVLIDEISGTQFLTDTEYAQMNARDLIIPYQRAYVEYNVKQGLDSTEAISDLYDTCTKYGYDWFAITSLESIKDNDTSGLCEIYLNELYRDLALKNTNNYCDFIDSEINYSTSTMQREHQDYYNMIITILIVIVIILAAIIAVAIIRQLLRDADVDGLTQIKNRRRLDRDIKMMDAAKQDYTVIMMDIDDFKHVNDTYGHQVGDQVLQRLGCILKSYNNQMTESYRYGGEEFVVIVRGNNLKITEEIATSILNDFRNTEFDFKEQQTLSLGIAKDSVKQADDCMYYAKQHGKNQVCSNMG